MASQKQKIRRHLLTEGSITSMEAFRRYKITRLAARINELRNDGMNIRTFMVESKHRGNAGNYARYRLISK